MNINERVTRNFIKYFLFIKRNKEKKILFLLHFPFQNATSRNNTKHQQNVYFFHNFLKKKKLVTLNILKLIYCCFNHHNIYIYFLIFVFLSNKTSSNAPIHHSLHFLIHKKNRKLKKIAIKEAE